MPKYQLSFEFNGKGPHGSASVSAEASSPYIALNIYMAVSDHAGWYVDKTYNKTSRILRDGEEITPDDLIRDACSFRVENNLP
ncbi:MAG: hypothetical protein HY367_03565 [Candidatus Aenigmarchaeota archaeon]|nr:hypothetical protein [Candidatus Aenigmarchaeota archaeon]